MSSHSDSDSELLDTQTPDLLATFHSQEIRPQEPVWGRLYPTTIYLPAVDLIKQYIRFGRSTDCDVIFSQSNFPSNSLITLSKNHLVITRGEQSAYISDLSKNGTFVNGSKVGHGNKVILENDDEIAVGTTKQKVYIYKTIENGTSPYLPPELKTKYEISRLLGYGACGEVRLAFEKTTFKKYAIKKIMKSKIIVKKKDLNTPARIKNEVKILQSLSHPCVISTIEVAETEDAVFIVLEYMEQGELTDLIDSMNSPLCESKVKLIFYQIVSAVRYLHLRNITHRDLKPGNVLLKSHGDEMLVKISDFGLSKMIDSDSLMSTICGTPSFVAPEILDAKCRVYTQQIDVWSMGVILYYMLSSELPFKSETQTRLFQLILSGNYSMSEQVWDLVSEDAKDLIRKMLVRNPEDRITVHDIMNHSWIAEDIDVQRKAKMLMNAHAKEDIEEVKRRRLD